MKGLNNLNVAIVGYGSIGKRHRDNFLALGHMVDLSSHHKGLSFKTDQYDLVVICSKTSSHLSDVKKYINFSENFLIEKPLAANLKDARLMKGILRGKKVRVGYCMIFNPLIKYTKTLIERKVIGEIFFAEIYAGSYLPAWRKTDYKKAYSADPAQGGGVELDLIHEINYFQYLLPDKISSIYSFKGHVSSLEIESNDIAHFLIQQKKRFTTITLSYFQRPPERFIKLVGKGGTLIVDILNKRIDQWGQSGKKKLVKKFDFDWNEMYINEVNSMVKFVDNAEGQFEMLSIAQGIKDLSIVKGKFSNE